MQAVKKAASVYWRQLVSIALFSRLWPPTRVVTTRGIDREAGLVFTSGILTGWYIQH